MLTDKYFGFADLFNNDTLIVNTFNIIEFYHLKQDSTNQFERSSKVGRLKWEKFD